MCHPYPSVTDMIGKLRWRKIEQWYTDSRLVLFHKIICDYVAVPFLSYVIPVLPELPFTGFIQIPTRTDLDKYSFYNLAVVQWNSLPAPIANLKDTDSFKRTVSQMFHLKPSYPTVVFIFIFIFMSPP